MSEDTKQKGIYILILRLSNKSSIKIGRLGEFDFKEGYYFYIGSAFGPGGIQGRLKHHIKISSNPHWHIDYLRKRAELIKILYCISAREYEHITARSLEKLFIAPVKNFGTSDCKCDSHLFYSGYYPDIEKIKIPGQADFKNYLFKI